MVKDGVYLTDDVRLVEVLSASGPLISARNSNEMERYLTIPLDEVRDDEHPERKWRVVEPAKD